METTTNNNNRIVLSPGDELTIKTVITNENVKETEKVNRRLIKTADGRMFIIKVVIKITEL